jgi:hypothetical protein
MRATKCDAGAQEHMSALARRAYVAPSLHVDLSATSLRQRAGDVERHCREVSVVSMKCAG